MRLNKWGEPVRVHRCSNCKAPGHYESTCRGIRFRPTRELARCAGCGYPVEPDVEFCSWHCRPPVPVVPATEEAA